jgi:hypothetical protein
VPFPSLEPLAAPYAAHLGTLTVARTEYEGWRDAVLGEAIAQLRVVLDAAGLEVGGTYDKQREGGVVSLSVSGPYREGRSASRDEGVSVHLRVDPARGGDAACLWLNVYFEMGEDSYRRIGPVDAPAEFGLCAPRLHHEATDRGYLWIRAKEFEVGPDGIDAPAVSEGIRQLSLSYQAISAWVWSRYPKN